MAEEQMFSKATRMAITYQSIQQEFRQKLRQMGSPMYAIVSEEYKHNRTALGKVQLIEEILLLMAPIQQTAE